MARERERAVRRGEAIAHARRAEAGGGLRIHQVQERLGDVSLEAVEAMLREGHPLAVPDLNGGPDQALLFPVCQFGPDGTPLPGLSALQAALPAGYSGWGVLDLLFDPHDAPGGRRPLDLLRTGTQKDRRRVLQAARGTDVQGA